MQLYPLKFQTIFKDKIWGGNKIKSILGKDYGSLPNCGETWEISAVPGNVSVVKEGELKGKNLAELIEEYKDRLIGKSIYKKFGNQFPLLVKFIDANDDLSIQVHPDDALAQERHNCPGKTEMWYIFQADKGARLNTGFKKPVDKETYLKCLQGNCLDDILNFEEVNEGDVFFLPAGRVHYIGKGICLAEIQQTSDITYRIYDFNRVDDKGKPRELHTELALDAIDFSFHKEYKTKYQTKINEPVNLVSCDHFTTNLISISQPLKRDYSSNDCFTIFVNLKGSTSIEYNGSKISMKMGDCVLVPAEISSLTLIPEGESKILESYIC
ncbi:MAG: type I phosphomannose isomerase catalytic subunit [Cytophagaceae bacterium]